MKLTHHLRARCVGLDAESLLELGLQPLSDGVLQPSDRFVGVSSSGGYEGVAECLVAIF